MRSQLKKDEKLLIIIRQHWMQLFAPCFTWLAITILLFLFAPVKIALIAALLLALYPAYTYIEWKNNLWAVTNMRVIDEAGYF